MRRVPLHLAEAKAALANERLRETRAPTADVPESCPLSPRPAAALLRGRPGR